MTDAVLRCDGLAHAFGDVKAVVDVGFEVAPGETYGLLGPNGAGKTTTISMICGLLSPDRGTILVAGEPMSLDAVDVKRNLGLVPQDIAIYPDLTARENLAFFGRLQGMAKPDLARRIDEVLEVIGLTDRADDRAEDYSGGMKRRLNIGIGLLHEPRLLILDEPTVGVDPSRATRSSSRWSTSQRRGWPCSTRPTTWRRPSASATASGSSTTVGCVPRAPGANSSL
jgi:ABC-2 type transport system ATP-binding protein